MPRLPRVEPVRFRQSRVRPGTSRGRGRIERGPAKQRKEGSVAAGSGTNEGGGAKFPEKRPATLEGDQKVEVGSYGWDPM